MAAPMVPPDSRLSLRAGEWAGRGGEPGATYLDVRVVDVGESAESGWVRVRGHSLECWWEQRRCPEPWCIEVLVRTEALYDAVNR